MHIKTRTPCLVIKITHTHFVQDAAVVHRSLTLPILPPVGVSCYWQTYENVFAVKNV